MPSVLHDSSTDETCWLLRKKWVLLHWNHWNRLCFWIFGYIPVGRRIKVWYIYGSHGIWWYDICGCGVQTAEEVKRLPENDLVEIGWPLFNAVSVCWNVEMLLRFPPRNTRISSLQDGEGKLIWAVFSWLFYLEDYTTHIYPLIWGFCFNIRIPMNQSI